MIKNKTNKTVISDGEIYLKDFKSKAIGLIFKEFPTSVIFETRLGIHTFGLRFPIDIILADENFKVIGIKKSISPNRLFFWGLKKLTILELESGKIEQSKTKQGDLLQIDL